MEGAGNKVSNLLRVVLRAMLRRDSLRSSDDKPLMASAIEL